MARVPPSETLDRVPPHLRRHVVRQDYAAYTAIDQAVWRFILLQLHARLRDIAHPAYTRGLEATGISVDRIPRIEEMDACLSDLGWGAVCVDGFIPPRAFQELQALGILPIAADIRRLEHLPYTPAPDIVHEAAGHAPILPDPVYARFLRRIGDMGRRAFTRPVDAEVYEAIYALSVAKERRGGESAEVHAAERALADAVARSTEPSEAGRLARLYWWTVEYGLVGTPRDYRLYGAGLLSSLGESHFCQAPEVAKVRLDASCADVGYDITRRQPQLFVAADFEHLEQVLDEVCASMAFRRGGLAALETAHESGEVATLELCGGLEVIGRVSQVHAHGGEPCLVELTGRVALARAGRLLEEPVPAEGLLLPLGRLVDGTDPAGLDRSALRSRLDRSRRLELRYRGGVAVVGRPRDLEGRGDAGVLHLDDACVSGHGARPRRLARLPLVLAGGAARVRAGASDPAFWPDAAFPDRRVPERAAATAPEAALLSLYERAQAADGTPGLERVFTEVHGALGERFQREWLLRWNLLESLGRRAMRHRLEAQLVDELRALEVAHAGEHPIASGLRFLGYDAEAAATAAG